MGLRWVYVYSIYINIIVSYLMCACPRSHATSPDAALVLRHAHLLLYCAITVAP